MKLDLINNANDSFERGLHSYNAFLESKDLSACTAYSDLKIAIIMLHNSLELFLKLALSKMNPLLIVDDIDDKSVIDSFKSIIKNKKLDQIELLLEDEKTKTAGYTKLVDRFANIYELKKGQRNCLMDINKLRNMLVHFGICKKKDFYKILLTINNAIELVTESLYVIFKKHNPLFKDIATYDIAESIVEHGKALELSMWVECYKGTLSTYMKWFNRILKDQIFLDFLIKNNLDYKKAPVVADICYHDLYILDKKNNDEIIALFINFSTSNNSIVLADEDTSIYIVLDCDKKCIYKYKNKDHDYVIYQYPEDYFQFEDDCKNKKCNKSDLVYDNFRKVIISTIKDSI